MKVPALLAAVIAPMLFVGACRSDTLQLSPPLVVRSVTTDTTGGRERLLIKADAPADFEIVYWTDGEPALAVHTSQPTDSLSLVVTQLRPGRLYEYEIRAVNLDGIPGPATDGFFTSPTIPAELVRLHLVASGELSVPAVMLEVNNSAYTGFVAVNGYGEPVWQWKSPGNPQGFTRRANGNFVFLDGANGLFEVTPAGTTVHRLDAHFSPSNVPHHDLIATPDNTILFIAQDRVLVGGRYVVGDCIFEWTPETDEVAKVWTAFDFYDPDTDVGARSTPTDWLHANSLALGDHGNVILSLNWISQVISISPDWQRIEWRFGGPRSTIAVDSASAFQGQHTATVLANGHLLVFDNGRDRAGAARNSRAKELEFAPGGTAHAVWTFTPSANQYDPYVGSARRLGNGNTLAFFGMRDGFAGAVGPMAAYEVRPSGLIAWKLVYDGGDINYRATPLSTIAGEIVSSASRFGLQSR